MQRSAVVTGGAAGIGYSIADLLIQAGYAVVVVDRDGEGLAAATNALGGERVVRGVFGDVGGRDTAVKAAAIADEIAPLELWVNNAGFSVTGAVDEISEKQFSDGVSGLLGGVFWGTAEAVRKMRPRRRGSIINISSIQALVSVPNTAVYAACKGAVIALSRQIGADLAGSGIRCNAIAPGLIDTTPGRTARIPPDGVDPEAHERLWVALTPIGRGGTPVDIAEAVLFLADDSKSGFITGQLLVIDGGLTTRCRGY